MMVSHIEVFNEITQKDDSLANWLKKHKKMFKDFSQNQAEIVKEILIDCDNDTILLKVKQVGNAACHTGYRSCFYRKLENGKLKTIGKKIFEPKEVYK